MKKIGLTGVMGAGKSSVITLLKQEHITVLDCDAINAKLLEKGERGYLALIQRFSNAIVNESFAIDKQKMSDLIFSQKELREEAEAILHPLIQEEIQKELKLHEQEALVVVEVPLLFEVKWESFFDEVWVVACEEEILLQRLQQYRNIAPEEAKRRLAVQMSQKEKIEKAQVVLWNQGNLHSLKQQIYDILESFEKG